MAVSLVHTTVAVGVNAGNGEIHKEQWNQEHTLTLATQKLLGRLTAGTGAAEEVPIGSGVATALSNTAGGAGGFALVGTTPPTGSAGGSLSGTYPNPALAAINTIATSLAIGGATIGSNALAVTGTAAISGSETAAAFIPSGSSVPTNGIYLPAANQLGFSTNSTLKWNIDSSGHLTYGYPTNLTVFRQTFIQTNTGANEVGFGSNRWTNDAFGAQYLLAKSRSDTVGTNTVVQSGDSIGNMTFVGADGTGFIEAARISVEVDGTPGTNDMPGRMLFATTADGAASLTERMRIDNAGSVGIGTPTTTAYNLNVGKNITGGSTAFGIASTGTIQSDATSTVQMVRAVGGTAAASFTLSILNYFSATQGTIGATSAVTSQMGYNAASSLTGATNNYGFYGNIAAASARWNFYAVGTARNYMAGALSVGGTTDPGTGGLYVGGTTASTSTTTGSGIFAGGIGVAGAAYIGGIINVASTTDSTSSTTGAAIIAGGIGVAKAIFGGSTIYSNSATVMLGSKTTITGGATGNVPTLTAGPVNGNPTKWLPYDDNGTTRYIPAW